MSRHERKLDRDALLEGSLDLFWGRGYERTSVTDLIARLHVHGTSLYRVFGSKEELYQQALERYRHRRCAAASRALADDRPLAAIRGFILEWTKAAADSRGRGCFLVNAAVERVPHDERTLAVVHAFWSQIEGELTAVLERAWSEGALSPRQDPRAVAQFLIAVMQGVSVMGKLTSDRDRLKEIVETALMVIEH